MDLWIRSQDKEVLMVVNTICIPNDEGTMIMGLGIDGKIKSTLGNYSSKKRCIELLDEIQNIIHIKNLISKGASFEGLDNYKEEDLIKIVQQCSVYEMPKE